jgi:hypothetical protein
MTEQQAREDLVRTLAVHTTRKANATWQPIANGINQACEILGDMTVIMVSAIRETGLAIVDMLQPFTDAYAKANGRMVDAEQEDRG